MSIYRDFQTTTSNNSRANDYCSVSEYNNCMTVPQTSLLLMNVAPGSDKFFSASPAFQARPDNFRIVPPAKVPINLGDEVVAPTATVMMSTREGQVPRNNCDYYSLSQGAYKLNPM